MMHMPTYRYHERGATSLIVVMFSVLLFTVVAVGFLQLMNHEQASSTDNELSRGAYDSALSGIEDGKRVLKACLDGDSTACTAICPTGDSSACGSKCTTISDAHFVIPESNGEVYLKSTTSSDLGTQYEQAYTCVKINLDTDNYLASLRDEDSVVVPLKTATTNASQITVSWFDSKTVTPSPGVTTLPSKTYTNWADTKPPILRIQLINLDDSDNLTTLDDASGGRTMYLYPTTNSSLPLDFGTTSRNRPDTTTTKLQATHCQSTGYLTVYACNTVITLPVGFGTVGGGTYARVTSIYNDTNLSISLQDGSGADVAYDRVQPSIDSTGRAADVFRRVEARVESTDDEVTYPRATIDITGNLCKTLSVTNKTEEYSAGSCTP